jgi:hypothetical protein
MTSDSTVHNVNELIQMLDGSGSDAEWGAAFKLRDLLGERLPELLLAHYKGAKKWKVRSSCVYHAVRYAKLSEAAISLALLALHDKSKVVRYRACMLLAWSQKSEVLKELHGELEKVPEDSKPDLLAAIDAIKSNNANYFVDRDHSGLTTLNIR